MHSLLELASAVFFDLDGTLIDSAADIHVSLNYALLKHQLKQVSECQVRSWVGRGALVLVESALDYCYSQMDMNLYERTSTDVVLASFLDYYQNNLCVHTRIYDGVLPVLKELKSSGKLLACITNKPILPASKLLEKLGLASYFSLVLGGDSLDHKKPHPQPLHHALTYYEIEPCQALMVGDSMFDILAAQAATIPCIGVLGGYNHGVPLEESNPTLVVSSFSALL